MKNNFSRVINKKCKITNPNKMCPNNLSIPIKYYNPNKDSHKININLPKRSIYLHNLYKLLKKSIICMDLSNFDRLNYRNKNDPNNSSNLIGCYNLYKG